MPADLTVTRIGHSCHLIKIGAIRILTDPWFTNTATYYHGEPVTSTVADLGALDAVIVSHEHYDHCDLDALIDGGIDPQTPLVGPGTVTSIASSKGFRDLRTIEAWESTTINDLTITATPAQHGVHEVTFVIQAHDRAVFFGGDSLRVPELDEIPHRFGHLDLALMPTNGLCLRQFGLRQVVMDAEQAAALTQVLKPTLAVPHHYAFHSGWLGNKLITKPDRDPRHFAAALERLDPSIPVRLVTPGTSITVP